MLVVNTTLPSALTSHRNPTFTCASAAFSAVDGSADSLLDGLSLLCGFDLDWSVMRCPNYSRS